MLVLSRKAGEKIILQTSDGPITIVVTSVRSASNVGIGIQAPSSIGITRSELLSPLPKEAPLAGRGVLVGSQ